MKSTIRGPAERQTNAQPRRATFGDFSDANVNGGATNAGAEQAS